MSWKLSYKTGHQVLDMDQKNVCLCIFKIRWKKLFFNVYKFFFVLYLQIVKFYLFVILVWYFNIFKLLKMQSLLRDGVYFPFY